MYNRKNNPNFSNFEKIQLETVIKINGKVLDRTQDTINKDIDTGEIKVAIENFEILGTCKRITYAYF